MNAMVFDTHEAANRFKAAGFTDDQIEALVDVTRRTTTLPDISTLATKTDLADLRSELKTDLAGVRLEIADLRSELKTDLAGVRLEIADLRSELRTEIAGVKTEMASVRTMIASTQVQTITVILTAVAAMLVLSRLIPGAVH